MLLLAKGKFLNKKTVRMMANFVLISKNSSHKHSKAIAKSKDKYFNYYKIGHFN